MTNAFIPEIGTKLKIKEDWTFSLHREYRNKHICIADNEKCDYNAKGFYERTLPSGSEFMVDRIYVRQGAKEYSSVTLFIIATGDKVLTKQGTRTQPFKNKGAQHYGRFWVKLTDFNAANFVVTEDSSVPSDAKPQGGDPIMLGRFKKRRRAHWWVKFTHEDLALCFDGEINTWLRNNYIRLRAPALHLVSAGWIEKSYETSEYSWKTKTHESFTEYMYASPHLVHCLIPRNWIDARKDVARFQVVEEGFNNTTITVTKHPLENQLHIPRMKKDRIPMGLKTDKSLMENIDVAGGKLTICEVVEK